MQAQSESQLPMVSVVIPLLNAKGDIPGCIGALRRQSYPTERFEIIVVDNGSTDGSEQALDEAGVRWIKYQERGRAKALNAGLAAAKGDIICTTDISCQPEPQWITQVVESFRDPTVGCVAGEIRLLRGRDSAVIRFQERTNYMSPMLALRRNRLPFLPFADGANASFRRKVFDEIGGFEEAFYKGADVEICYRIFMLTRYKILFNHRAVVWEPGEPNLRALLKQRYRIGLGTPLMHLKYPGLYAQHAPKRSVRSWYWNFRGGSARLGRMAAGFARGLLDARQRASAVDEVIWLVLGIAQRYGAWRGRRHVYTAEAPRAVDSTIVSAFLAAGGSVRERVVEVP
jgi:cellulose synthase/poly-beta-1,6-N-acetylglucosamine synthase-like glycosyltransferase